MMYGLSENQLGQIVSFLSKYPSIEKAVLFGSRALGNFKEASDVDIALFGDQVTAGLAAKIKFEIEEETYLPYFFDIIAYPTITNSDLKNHILSKGVELYSKA